jgi:hypothetical protein
MTHCIECGTGLSRRAIYCPACAARRPRELDENTFGDVNPASFLVMETEMLIAPARLATGQSTSSDAPSRRSSTAGARNGRASARFIVGCGAIVITVATIANALLR